MNVEDLIEELTKVKPTNLSKEGLKLFNTINKIIDRNKELEKLELEHQKINGNLREKIKELEYKYQRALSDLVIAENTKHTCPYIPTSGVTCDVKEYIKQSFKPSSEETKEELLCDKYYDDGTTSLLIRRNC